MPSFRCHALAVVVTVAVLASVADVLAAPVVHSNPNSIPRSVRVGHPEIARTKSGYLPPIEPRHGTIVDHFRRPPHPYGPGNRGLDYATLPLSPVHASADGEVLFAGSVAGALHVTIRHADGLRTSYSFLAGIAVRAGDQVLQQEVIGVTGEAFHFGVRDAANTYLDPEALFSNRVSVQLVPSGDDGAATLPLSGVKERFSLAKTVRDRISPLTTMLGRTRNSRVDFLARLRMWAHYARELSVDTHIDRFARGLIDWTTDRRDCTAAEHPTPRLATRHIAVLVGGIGSTSDQAAVDGVDAVGLGYSPVDILRFSYAGGRVPNNAAGSALNSIASHPYDARDSQSDLFSSAERLDELLVEIARLNPGVPIDLIGHSQGGLVARLAIEHGAATGSLPREVSTLVTLGSPHGGANLATALEAVNGDTGGAIALESIQRAAGLELDPDLPAAHQLSQLSPTINDLRSRSMPSSVRFTSIGARGDLVVPAGRTDLSGQVAEKQPAVHHTVVPMMGLHAHDQLPRSLEAKREIALAVAGLAPTCRGLAQVTADLLASDLISWSEDRMGATAALGFAATPP